MSSSETSHYFSLPVSIHSWALQCGLQSVPPFVRLLDCPTVGTPLAAPENKQPSLSFQGGVLTLRCLCCRCHLLSLFFCCRSSMARPPVMAGVLPTGTRCRETVTVKHKHLTDPARVKILAWHTRKLQTEQAAFLKQDAVFFLCK